LLWNNERTATALRLSEEELQRYLKFTSVSLLERDGLEDSAPVRRQRKLQVLENQGAVIGTSWRIEMGTVKEIESFHTERKRLEEQ
jgi:hypothetical protein